MAHSAQVPAYSTQLLILKIGIVIVPLIDLSTLVESSHITINEDDVFGHVLSPPWYHGMSFPLYVGLLTSALPAVLQCMHAHHFCQKPQLTCPRYKQFYLSQIFLVPSKTYPSLGMILLVENKTYSPIVRFTHHRFHTIVLTQDVYIYVQ